MQFNSYTFVLFFIGVLALHYAPLPWRVKKFNLLWASYLFYAAWNPPFVVLLWISTLLDWFCAKWIFRSRTPGVRRAMLVLTLATNLGMLGFFKYGGFLLANFAAVVNALGFAYHPAPPNIILPAGISFYTFVTLSYSLDVYRGVSRPAQSFLDYALFVTFFPHLVAGPIIRDTDFLYQLEKPKQATPSQFGWGLILLTVGLFQKVVLADGLLAPISEMIFDSQGAPTFADAWVGTLAFAGQIFFDFAGYSTCAVGVAMCLGFWLPENFRSPYGAMGFSDFWRRWHITLSTWLRDYLYIPLGGNRRGGVRTYFNLMITMLLGGLWHGASWTFVIWGGLHGCLLCAERLVQSAWPATTGPPSRVARPFFLLATFVAVCFTWVFFRARTLDRALAIVAGMIGLTTLDGVQLVSRTDAVVALVITGALVCVHAASRDRSLKDWVVYLPWWLCVLGLAAMVAAVVLTPGEDRAFIYFQF